MIIRHGATLKPLVVSAEQLAPGLPYTVYGTTAKEPQVFMGGFMLVGAGTTGETKIPKVINLSTGQIYGVDKVKHLEFILCHAELVI